MQCCNQMRAYSRSQLVTASLLQHKDNVLGSAVMIGKQSEKEQYHKQCLVKEDCMWSPHVFAAEEEVNKDAERVAHIGAAQKLADRLHVQSHMSTA